MDEYINHNYDKILSLLLIAFIEPQMFKTIENPTGDRIYMVLKLISALIIFILYLRSNRIRKFDFLSLFMTLVMIVVQLIILVSTLINNGSIIRYAGPAITAIVLTMAAQLAVRGNLKKLLSYLSNYLSILIAINLISWILLLFNCNPFNVSFLGIDNRWIYTFLPACTISLLLAYFDPDKFKFAICLTIYCTIQLIVVWSVGAMISMITFLLLLCILMKFEFIEKVIQKYGSIFFNIFWILINYIFTSGLFSSLFKDLLSRSDKGPTFSGRTNLWRAVYDTLAQKPLTGMGVQDSSFDRTYLGKWGTSSADHPHNFLLNIGYHGGIFAIVLFYIYCIVPFVVTCKKINNLGYKILFCYLVAFSFASIFDTLDFSLIYFLITLASCLPVSTEYLNLQNNRNRHQVNSSVLY